MRALWLIAVAAVAAGSVVASPAAAVTDHAVDVTDNAFLPGDVEIAPGDRVVWSFQGANSHTVTSTTGAFDSGQRGSGTFDLVFSEAGTYGYYCQVHGAATMRGVVQVGPSVEEPPATGPIRYVTDGPTLVEAVGRAAAGTTIVLEPGRYELLETIEVATPGLTIRGGRRPAPTDPGTDVETEEKQKEKKKDAPSTTEPAPEPEPDPVSPEEVVITSGGGLLYAFHVTARGDGDPLAKPVTAVEDLSITGFRLGGIKLTDAEGYRLARLRIGDPYGTWDHAVVGRGARRGRIEDVDVAGSRYAGVSVQHCSPCDVRVRRLAASDNFIGFEALAAAGGIEVTSSTFRDNVNGIVLQSPVGATPAFGAYLDGNTVTGTGAADAPRPTVFQPERATPGEGVGIWLAGASQTTVARNLVVGGRYPIAVTARGSSSDGNRIQDNVVGGGTSADLAWDGIGRGTCFSGNRTEAGEDPHSSPLLIQTLYPCGRTTVGVANPVVGADLALAALRSWYCQLDARLCP